MREILFKAKRVDNGEWIEGLVKHKPIYKKHVSSLAVDIIVEKWVLAIQVFCQNNGLKYLYECLEIIPKTLCQYTGLNDVNGEKIYAGDILKKTLKDYGFRYVVKYNGNEAMFEFVNIKNIVNDDYISLCADDIDAHLCEVISNIHDEEEEVKE